VCVCIASTNVDICYDLKRTSCNIVINPKYYFFIKFSYINKKE